MPIDRNDTLRRAEKLLRQGRVDAAIAEYAQVVAAYPADLATANLLGDLHLRAGHVDRAVSQYTALAERLVREGFVPKAMALYKKVIKITPDDDASLLRTAELAAAHGLVADARTCYQAAFQVRLRRGDREGAAAVAITRVELDPGDAAGRLDAARLLAELGQASAAAEQAREAGLRLIAQGRHADGLRALGEALRFHPEDLRSRDHLIDALLQTGDVASAAGAARSGSQFGRVARAMFAEGRGEEAVRCLGRAAADRPGDAGLRVELARAELACGRPEHALGALPPEAEGEGREVALLRAACLLRVGRAAESRSVIERIVRDDPGAVAEAAEACLSAAAADSRAALTCLDPVIDLLRRTGDLMTAKAIAQRAADLSSDPIEALRLLVDVCDDLADDDGVYHGQVKLADALLAATHYGEARVLAELLIAKRPDVARHRERLQAATEGLGPSLAASVAAGLADREEDGDAVTECAPGPAEPDAAGMEEPESHEVDLSLALNEMLAAERASRLRGSASQAGLDPVERTDGIPAVPPGVDVDSVVPPAPPEDLESFFDVLRRESGAEGRTASAAQSFDLASQAYSEGRLDESVRHLEEAARDPAFRFRAAALLARLERDAGRVREAIEWLERAAESPAPSAGAWDALLYDLGSTLEQAGETQRALAVLLELQSASPGYRDVDDWVGRLSAPGVREGRIPTERNSG